MSCETNDNLVSAIGSELFVLFDGAATKIGGVTAVTLGDESRDEIDITPLDASYKQYWMGLRDAGEATMEIPLDPTDAGYLALETLDASGACTTFALGLGDGDALADVDVDGFDLDEGRSWVTFEARVKTLTLIAEVGQPVKASVTLRRLSKAVPTWKTATPAVGE